MTFPNKKKDVGLYINPNTANASQSQFATVKSTLKAANEKWEARYNQQNETPLQWNNLLDVSIIHEDVLWILLLVCGSQGLWLDSSDTHLVGDDLVVHKHVICHQDQSPSAFNGLSFRYGFPVEIHWISSL